MQVKTSNLTYTKISCQHVAESQPQNVGAVLLAAGTSSRMCGKDKLFENLCGVPVIVRSLIAFENSSAVKQIVLVGNKNNIPRLQQLVQSYELTKVSDIVAGGKSRAQSAKNGCERLFKTPQIKTVLIHDGGRPLVSDSLIKRVIDAAETYSAAIPAVPLKDTVKETGAIGRVISTPERKNLVAVQTPQGFSVECYKKALSAADDLSGFTDDSSIVEASAQQVYTVLGDNKNIKITTPEDLVVAEALFRLVRGEAGI